MLPFLIRAVYIGIILYVAMKLVRGFMRLGFSRRGKGAEVGSSQGRGPAREPARFEFEEDDVLDVPYRDRPPSSVNGPGEGDGEEDKEQH